MSTPFTITRGEGKPVEVPLAPFADNRLSWATKGLLTYLMTQREGAAISCGEFAAMSTDKEADVVASLSQLLELDYVTMTVDELGQMLYVPNWYGGNLHVMAGFDEFWAEYPSVKKKCKIKAQSSWRTKSCARNRVAILNALRVFKTQEDWLRDSGTYIPYPVTWLNQERWKEIDEQQQATVQVADEAPPKKQWKIIGAHTYDSESGPLREHFDDEEIFKAYHDAWTEWLRV